MKENDDCCIPHRRTGHAGGGIMGGTYGLAFLGALIYFLQQADSFWMGVFGILKALVWPAILVYHLLGQLNI